MKKLVLGGFVLLAGVYAQGQEEEETNWGEIHGNTQIILQQYSEDSLIGAVVPDEITALNAFTNVIYTKGNFSAGIRLESYLNAQLGYPERFRGTGLGYRFVTV